MSECREVAEEVIRKSSLHCMIAGSLRRGEEYTHDVDIVCADPSLPENESRITRFEKNTCSIDLYSANPKHFGAMMLTYTGRPAGSNIGLRVKAAKKGMKLNQYGLFNKATGELIASETEEEIFEALDHPWKPPEQRGK